MGLEQWYQWHEHSTAPRFAEKRPDLLPKMMELGELVHEVFGPLLKGKLRIYQTGTKIEKKTSVLDVDKFPILEIKIPVQDTCAVAQATKLFAKVAGAFMIRQPDWWQREVEVDVHWDD